MLFGDIQVIPLVADTGQAKICFAGSRPRRITCQLQDAPVALGRQRELVFCFLYLAQTGCSRYGDHDISRCLADRYDFGIGLAGRGTVSLELIGIPQRPVSGSADRQVVGVQILQGAPRLGNDGFHLVGRDSQHGPYGGNMSDKVSGFVIWLGLLQGSFSSL